MGRENSVIETGVDKLVELIRAKKRISVKDAAKELGVGPIVTEEWADFLEEEGIISIEYKFATPFLVERKLSKDEVQKKEKEFHSKKEGFVRKAEVTLAILDRESEDFKRFKDKFDKLKSEMGSELVHVHSEIKQLEKLESLKKSIDLQIDEQEKKFHEKMDIFERELKKEEQKYRDIVESIGYEQERLDKERLDTISLREREMSIKKKLKQFQENITTINKAVNDEESIIDNSEKRIMSLKKLSEKIKKELVASKDKGKDLNKQKEAHKNKIDGLQEEILHKVERNKEKIEKKMEEGKMASKKFKEFFNKKTQIEKIIKDMDKQKDELEYELIDLIKKAKAFHLSSSSTGLKGHVKNLEKTFDNINKEKGKFEEEAIKLSSLLK